MPYPRNSILSNPQDPIQNHPRTPLLKPLSPSLQDPLQTPPQNPLRNSLPNPLHIPSKPTAHFHQPYLNPATARCTPPAYQTPSKQHHAAPKSTGPQPITSNHTQHLQVRGKKCITPHRNGHSKVHAALFTPPIHTQPQATFESGQNLKTCPSSENRMCL